MTINSTSINGGGGGIMNPKQGTGKGIPKPKVQSKPPAKRIK